MGTQPGTWHHDRHERGQIIVIFALALIAMIAMVGLILDGGAAFAHRRDEQTASDLAALAGANAFLVNYDQPLTRDAAAVAAAREAARVNGYEHGVGGVTVDVAIDTTVGAQVTVDIDAPHENTFARIVGMNSWQIATTATALTGFGDTAVGAGPMLFNVGAFDTDDGTPLPLYGDPDHPFTFSHGQGQSGDAPADAGSMSWTDYSGDTNDDTSTVRDIIRGETSLDVTLDRGQYIGQHNNGQHADLFEEVDTWLAGIDIPVPIVDENGIFQGWATFHVTSASRSDKTVTGYFKSNFVAQRLTIKSCSIDVDCPVYLGSFTLKLVN
jgi:Flp pilus assembly protein TadG